MAVVSMVFPSPIAPKDFTLKCGVDEASEPLLILVFVESTAPPANNKPAVFMKPRRESFVSGIAFSVYTLPRKISALAAIAAQSLQPSRSQHTIPAMTDGKKRSLTIVQGNFRPCRD